MFEFFVRVFVDMFLSFFLKAFLNLKPFFAYINLFVLKDFLQVVHYF